MTNSEYLPITAQKPTKTPVILSNGSIVVASVESYDTVEDTVSACSFIARNNIAFLLESMEVPPHFIARGDASRLIELGRVYGALDSYYDKSSLLNALDVRKKEHGETVFDVYRFVESRPVEIQWHRVAVFLWDDNNWYILDPLDGKKTRNPQLFSEFLAEDVTAEWLVRIPGFNMANPVSYDEFLLTLPLLSPELYVFFQQQYLQVPWKLRYIEA
jgi:hypothetical protein